MPAITIIETAAHVHDATAHAIAQVENVKIIGQASSVNAAVKSITMSDIVLFKAPLPTDPALTDVNSIIKSNPSCKILVFGLKKSEAAALAFIEAGCSGYVFETDPPMELVRNIHAIESDCARISTQMAASLMQRVQALTVINA